MRMEKEMKLEIFPEQCCEVCSEIIHNHFHCPKCNNPYAGTSWYGEPWDRECGDELECEECRVVFILVNKGNDYLEDYEFKEKNESP